MFVRFLGTNLPPQRTGPFAERVSAAALWQDDRMQEGLARLRYLVEQATVALVTGASGVGKSALLKLFLHELHGPRWQPVYLHLTHLSAAGLLKLLVGKLGELPRRGKERLFEQILGKALQAEGGLLVVLDEARLIHAEALTDITTKRDPILRAKISPLDSMPF